LEATDAATQTTCQVFVTAHKTCSTPKKPVGWNTDALGRRRRRYDKPRSPYQRLLDSGVLGPAQEAELAAVKATLKPVAIQHRISEIQQELTWKAPTPQP